MKIFTEKGIVKKLILIFVVVMIFNALIPNNVSFAASDETSAGGVLLKPIADLMLLLGDAVMDLMHNVIYGMDTALIRVDKDNGILEFIVIGIAIIGVALAIIAGGAWLTGAALKIIGAIATHIGTGATATALTAAAIGTIVSVGIQGGVAAGMFVRSEFFSDEVVFPLYQISPEEIFRGEIALLNVNFFKDKAEILAENSSKEIDVNTSALTNTQSILERAYNVTRTMSGQNPTQLSNAENAINQALKDNGYSGEKVQCIRSNNKKMECTRCKWKECWIYGNYRCY